MLGPAEKTRHYIAVIEDITERKTAEDALRRSEQDLRLFALAIHDTLSIWDFETAIVKRSVGFETHFGYPADLIEPDVGWWVERIHPEDRARVWKALCHAMEGTANSWSEQYRFRKRDDSYAIVDHRLCLLRDKAGKAMRALGAMKDITKQVEDHAALLQVLHLLVVAEEGERRRIARELHDSTVQGLVAAMMNLEFLREKSAEFTPEAARQVEDSFALLENCAHEIRTLSYLLHPPRLDDTGLSGAIDHYVTGFGERTGLTVSVDLPADIPRLTDTVEMILFRMVQEALANVHRHAHSKTASVRLRLDGSGIVLEISDEGRGIPPQILDAGPAGSLGVGLPGMRERLRQIGGRLEIESNSSGTLVRAVVLVEKIQA